MYHFKIIDDNGDITHMFAKSRSEAIKLYCDLKGCSEEYIKNHCIVKRGDNNDKDRER